MVIGDFGSQELELGARARHSELGILVSLLFVLRSAKAGWKYLRPPCELGQGGFGKGASWARMIFFWSLAVLAVKQLGYSGWALGNLCARAAEDSAQIGVGLGAWSWPVPFSVPNLFHELAIRCDQFGKHFCGPMQLVRNT
ncbi:unnamed protein product [Prunus armeniaca]|uniref:Uncharacterized protein n=1 Tax=Prunus armeniaca TaxID=36596 RepID=A0A6J5Y6N4_PRUAR|nr:unnamed protein product [Prunus armeniaca]